jgi:hypothetical protein
MIKPVLRVLCLGILSGVLFGCGGDNAQINEQSILKGEEDQKDPVACASVYEPVCSVELKNIQCITTPCPVGVHKTFPNRCESDAAKAKFLAEGVCGDLEGEPYFKDPVACEKIYEPVCGAVQTTAPCDTVPCPKWVAKTFGNECEARAAQAFIVSKGECKDSSVDRLTGACPAVYAPVCAKATASIACITQPCPTHVYKSFGNSCEATLELANLTFNRECSKLEGALASAEPPVIVSHVFPEVIKQVVVSDVAFDGDLLSLTLTYGGCDAQYFNLYVSESFMESHPVQAKTLFKPMVEDTCKALITSKATYDLMPLKHTYQQAYGTENGEIVLQGIGTYVF